MRPGVTLAVFRVSFRGPAVKGPPVDFGLAESIARGLDWEPEHVGRVKAPRRKARASSPPTKAERKAAWARKEARDRGDPPPAPAPVRRKRCSTCRKKKPADSAHFHARRESTDGLQSTCIECGKRRDTIRNREEAAARGSLRRAAPRAEGPALDVDVFGDPIGAELPAPGRFADACARSFRTYEREERERRAFTPDVSMVTGFRRVEGVQNVLPKEDPREVWSVDDDRALDEELDRQLETWARGVLAERDRLIACGWNGRKAGIPDGDEEEDQGEEHDGAQREGRARGERGG